MRYSQLFIPTRREVPEEAVVASHILMVRAGMIRQLAQGLYTLLPLGLRTIRKVENIIREEMNAAGALELFMPTVQPAEIWKESGRWDQMGDILLRFKNRTGAEFVLGPTHEEVITDIVRDEVRSYRDMPLNLYQIQTKYRDEIRPRFGLMRGREFCMKDNYSFDVDEEASQVSYDKMYDAYTRIFTRCGVSFRAVEADSGPIGGSYSHEFMVLADSGEDVVATCPACGYAANLEKTLIRDAALAPYATDETELPMEKVLTPGATSMAKLLEQIDVPPSKTVETLIYQVGDELVGALVPGDRSHNEQNLNEIKFRNHLGAEHVELADPDTVRRVSAFGFAGPVGLAGKIRLVADHRVKYMKNFVVGANENDYHLVNVNLGRDFEIEEFADLCWAVEGDPCPKCEEGALSLQRGIEVGQVFKLGTKYSAAMGATFTDRDGAERAIVMGCYGIGVGRTMAAAIEQNHDEHGIIWPWPLAPYQVLVMPINIKSDLLRQEGERIHDLLEEAGYEVILDDRDERAGVKFNDADLIGIPLRIVLGEKNVKAGQVEISTRRDKERIMVARGEVLEKVEEMAERLQELVG